MTPGTPASSQTQKPSSIPPSTEKQPMISRLGRGLGSLIPAAPSTPPAQPTVAGRSQQPSEKQPIASQIKPSVAPSSPEERSTWNTPQRGEVDPASAGAVFELELTFIARNARQPREKFDDRAITTLAESVTQHGLIQPIVVRKLKLPVGGKTYELIAGERRMRAFEKLGKAKIPAIMMEATDAASAVLALIENVQREDLNPLERAVALKRLITDFSWTQQQAAEKVGIDRASVANLLRLIDLDPFTSGCVREGRLSQGHAKALLSIENVQARRAIAEKALHDEWSVRQVEREVQRIKTATGLATPSAPPATRKGSAQVGDLERRLGQFIGSKVQIKQGRKAGTGMLSIAFYSLDQFDGILQRLGFDSNSLKD